METLIFIIIIIILWSIWVRVIYWTSRKLDDKITREIELKDISLLKLANEREQELFVKNYIPYTRAYSCEKNLEVCSNIFVMDGIITDVSYSTEVYTNLSNSYTRHTIQLDDGTTFIRTNDMKDKYLLNRIQPKTHIVVFFEKVDDSNYLYRMYYPKRKF